MITRRGLLKRIALAALGGTIGAVLWPYKTEAGEGSPCFVFMGRLYLNGHYYSKPAVSHRTFTFDDGSVWYSLAGNDIMEFGQRVYINARRPA
ncbi:hypothetical protein LCGC14_0373140 [marine sediment metagenome]|uniref:Twin-arginine translocation signal domain-containing protein n=1 Tax=marine sediment metagenome TaxID=412755 RepID=A0A0F9TA89_9ZZZZ